MDDLIITSLIVIASILFLAGLIYLAVRYLVTGKTKY
jgi:hypothetical protein